MTTTEHTEEPTANTLATDGPAKKDDAYYLSRAPIWHALVHLCVPMMAALSVGVVYNIINAGMIGALHNTAMLSAITFGLPVFSLMMAIGGVFGVGGGTAISRLLGAAGPAGADASGAAAPKRVAAFTFWGATAAGAVIGAVCLALLHPLVGLLGVDAAATGPTTAYVGVMLAFMPVLVCAFAAEQLVRAQGAARASMTGMILGTVANLAFDVLFILVLGWGVAGAALAVGLANLATVGYYAWQLQTRSGGLLSIAPRWFAVRPAILKEVLGVGVSELLMSAFMIVTSLVLNHLAVGYGDGVLAAFGVALRVVQLPETLCMGVFMGVLPLIAYAYGRGDVDRLRSALTRSAIAIAALVLLFSTPVFLLRGDVLGLFSQSEQVLAVGVAVLTAMLVSTLFNGFTGLLIATFQGAGQAMPATVMSIAQGVLFIPVVLVGHALFGLNGLVWAMTVTEALCLAAALVLFAARRRSILRPTAEAAEAADAVEATASVAVTL